MTREDLQAISELMDEKLKPINERLDKMDQRLDTIEEGQAEQPTVPVNPSANIIIWIYAMTGY